MSDSSDYSHDTASSKDLRARAELLQRLGNAPTTRGHVLGTEALSVLYKLACSPDGMADGLKMLHELQTHQIELDLLQEQNEATTNDAIAELAHYRTLYEFAPIGYFVLGSDFRIIESNRAGAALLRTARSEIEGSPLEDFIVPASRSVLSWHLKKLLSGSSTETYVIQTGVGKQAEYLQVFAGLTPGGDILLLATKHERSRKPGEF